MTEVVATGFTSSLAVPFDMHGSVVFSRQTACNKSATARDFKDEFSFAIKQNDSYETKWLKSSVQNSILHIKILKLTEENRRLQIKNIELEVKLHDSTHRTVNDESAIARATLSSIPAAGKGGNNDVCPIANAAESNGPDPEALSTASSINRSSSIQEDHSGDSRGAPTFDTVQDNRKSQQQQPGTPIVETAKREVASLDSRSTACQSQNNEDNGGRGSSDCNSTFFMCPASGTDTDSYLASTLTCSASTRKDDDPTAEVLQQSSLAVATPRALKNSSTSTSEEQQVVENNSDAFATAVPARPPSLPLASNVGRDTEVDSLTESTKDVSPIPLRATSPNTKDLPATMGAETTVVENGVSSQWQQLPIIGKGSVFEPIEVVSVGSSKSDESADRIVVSSLQSNKRQHRHPEVDRTVFPKLKQTSSQGTVEESSQSLESSAVGTAETFFGPLEEQAIESSMEIESTEEETTKRASLNPKKRKKKKHKRVVGKSFNAPILKKEIRKR